MPFYGYNRPGAKVSEGMRDVVLAAGHAGRHQGLVFDCIEQFSETDFTEDLKKFDVPTLIAARRRRPDRADRRLGAAVRQARPGRDAQGLQGRVARHVHDAKDEVNADLLAFIKG